MGRLNPIHNLVGRDLAIAVLLETIRHRLQALIDLARTRLDSPITQPPGQLIKNLTG